MLFSRFQFSISTRRNPYRVSVPRNTQSTPVSTSTNSILSWRAHRISIFHSFTFSPIGWHILQDGSSAGLTWARPGGGKCTCAGWLVPSLSCQRWSSQHVMQSSSRQFGPREQLWDQSVWPILSEECNYSRNYEQKLLSTLFKSDCRSNPKWNCRFGQQTSELQGHHSKGKSKNSQDDNCDSDSIRPLLVAVHRVWPVASVWPDSGHANQYCDCNVYPKPGAAQLGCQPTDLLSLLDASVSNDKVSNFRDWIVSLLRLSLSVRSKSVSGRGIRTDFIFDTSFRTTCSHQCS